MAVKPSSSRHKRASRAASGAKTTMEGVNVVQSSIHTECMGLLREMWKCHDEAAEFFYSLRAHVSDIRSMVRVDKLPAEQDVSVDFIQLGVELKLICDNITVALNQFDAIAQFQSQLKLALFTKIRQAKQHLSQDRLGILTCIFNLVESCMKLRWWELEDKFHPAKQALVKLAQVYNWCLEATWFESGDGAGSTAAPSSTVTSSNLSLPMSSRIKVLRQIDYASSNDCASLGKDLKSLSILHLIEQLAIKRATDLSERVSLVLQASDQMDPAQLKAELEKAQASNMTLFGHVFHCVGKRFSSKEPSAEKEVPQVTVNDRNTGSEQAMSSSTKSRLAETFQHTLWAWTGEICSEVLLWSFHSNSNSLPLALNEPALLHCLQLSLASDDLTGFLALLHRTVIMALNTFVQLTRWDERMQAGFTMASVIKRPEHVQLVRNPTAGQYSTAIVAIFGDICKSCITLLHKAHEKTSRDPLNAFIDSRIYEEAALLFRVEATISYFNIWLAKRAKLWLNAWAVTQFIACSQRDTGLLHWSIQAQHAVLVTREILLTSEVTPLRLAALHRKTCSEDLLSSLAKLKAVPEELLLAVGPVTHTLSLATLQSNMPPIAHWKGLGPASGLNSERPSSYVPVFIAKVLEPVMSALVEFIRGIAQEAMGKHVVQAACEAWLQFFQQKRVRFSEWGAIQLLKDFNALRDWISNDTQLEPDAKKSLMQLEVLKTCEGVAYLLMRSPGDVLGVGKTGRKNRRVAPTANGSTAGTPRGSQSSSATVAEDDIPPEMYVPNQQIWLELRFRRPLFSCCE